ncbi:MULTISPECIES: hypothetical protein [Yersinia pseudotuberculosis complex]|uniref:DUF4177 domain-containing protein n=4 Tax=Yersinia pseudotuberculosis complex TaxID=1649845 RepID=A0A0T9PIY1_9GAMM|nr:MULTISPECIES: hypothetical protein [Yersinia pseudotuberculosis complex]AHK21391.1 hypothetical protein BF17_20545 [Yersinia similis]AJK14549.1 hypothetical protein BZ19_1654 [Yersinia pseudotuberculosis str. PA3606]MCE4114802.1 DUF4177 domain-containing protein [Yersinia pseudotuberculosis]MCF1165398.1 DUF4177 domain-containing protein [Yersinia pseudotuberculosis]UFA61425.1 Uncharacterized protein YP598_1804 [Yersinia pseudotuberculosis]
MFTYKMVQIPPNISVNAKANKNGIAAQYLEEVVNSWASEGWEFQRIDTIGIDEKPGCFGGNKSTLTHYYVITFRKEV